jgi:probable F420-dependent oxidoreductase
MPTTNASDAPLLAVTLGSFSATDPGDWTPLLDRARAADRAGVDRVVVSDHVVFGENLEAYAQPELGGVRGGKQPTGPDGLWLEPITVLTAISSITERVRLGTTVLQAALRRPVVLAKTLATLDVLSGGRVDLGVGVGWQREEYEAAGLHFDRRGRTLDQTLEICQRLWTEQAVDYESEDLSFSRIHCMPKPRQAGGIPIWVSGTLNKRVLERIVRFGAGWIPWGDDAIELAAAIDRLREALVAGGRDPKGFRVLGSLGVKKGSDGAIDLGATMATVPDFVAAGVTDFRIALNVPEDVDGATEQFAAAVEAFRAAAT